MQSRQSRNNPQIWRLAKWIFMNFPVEYDDDMDWDSEWQKNKYYDKAAELIRKIESKDFVGQDQHED